MSTALGFFFAIIAAGVTYLYYQPTLKTGPTTFKPSEMNTPQTERITVGDTTMIAKDEVLYKVPVMRAFDDRVTFTAQELSYLKGVPASTNVNSEYLMLIGNVPPPTLKGKAMQATNVHIQRDVKSLTRRVYISYALRGEEFLGAVQIIEIQSYPMLRVKDVKYLTTKSDVQRNLISKAKVLQTTIFNNFDINTAIEKKGYLYLGGGAGDSPWPSPATLEIVKLTSDGLIPKDFKSTRVGLPSYTVTGMVPTGGKVYVSTGDAHGGVLELPDPRTLKTGWTHYEKLAHVFHPMEDVRDIAIDHQRLYAVKANPAAIMVMNFQDKLATAIPVNVSGGSITESKATIELTRRSIIVALGEGGMSMVDRDQLKMVSHVRQAPHKKDLNLSVTNGASGSANRLFTADGEAGARVMRYDPKTQTFSETARIVFGDGKSVNDIQYFNGVLVMATGTAGVQIAQLYRANMWDIIQEYRDYNAEAQE